MGGDVVFAEELRGVFRAGGGTVENPDFAVEIIVQRLGEESVVLLKNEDNFLPLSEEQVSEGVNLFGWAATDQGFIVVGGGSGGTDGQKGSGSGSDGSDGGNNG